MPGTHVIILAQGNQSRLPGLIAPKQMVPLPACGDVPVLARTCRLIFEILGQPREATLQSAFPDDPRPVPVGLVSDRVTIVTWAPLVEHLIRHGMPIGGKMLFTPHAEGLLDPGNSSLKGIARYLEVASAGRAKWGFDRTVVLLGDVIYSWRCLEALLLPRVAPIVFVGTSDLSESDGELWGIAWNERDPAAVAFLNNALQGALARTPPFKAYQPGQLRQWLFQLERAIGGAKVDGLPGTTVMSGSEVGALVYQRIDDYTDDIDTPEDLANVPHVAARAALDDAEHGVTW
jgi:hypothetical protein